MKRVDNANDYNYNKNKRLKVQQSDDVWGDDPAIEDVDRCIDLATQICSQSQPQPQPQTGPTRSSYKHNPADASYSIINYDCFKEKTNLVASTQAFDQIQLLEIEKNKIFEENKTKSGEIAFLRAQLKQSQNLVSKEKLERLKILQQNQETFDEKLNIKIKELASLKCENELKDLEVANLRQKLTELKKIYNCNITFCNNDDKTTTPQCVVPISKNETEKPKNVIVYSFKNTFYPYRELLFHFEENFQTVKDPTTELQCFIPNFILKVANYTEEQINNTDEFIEFVTKLNKYIEEYLQNVLIKLVKLNKSRNTKNCNNNLYLKLNVIHTEYHFENVFCAKPWSEFEIEIDLRRFIAIVTYLFQHSAVFYNLLRKQLNNQYHLNDFQLIDLERVVKNMDILQCMLQITIYVKNHHLTEQLCGFLASTLKFLSVLCNKDILPENHYHLIFEIFKQILFAQPNEPVLQYICYFLKYISEHGHFMSMLCARKKSNETQIKDGLLYFSDETCTFKVLATIIETCKLQIDTAYNLMHFLQNLVTCNVYWMYHQNQQSCGCLGDIYGLGITILYKSLENFTTNYKENFLTIFHVGLLFLHVLTVRIPDLVAKCSRLYSQYQTIIKYMYKMRDQLFFTNAHEIMLDNLISQLNCDLQNNETQNTTINMKNYFYDCNFINF